ncbi:TonB-dependent receptor [Croceicoccus ponticola]|uniref:TonB-dependent receptor n=1 Tax=Croceicoccus ponticola TaxID=2217664 RepID=A0A437GWI1_9SPHN|nr:TonB-dependent receptor [Croceicoccus ponticola]RVQ66468.1 TonB-dependent receptor [Croceicoccus ponticola]
MKLNTIRKRALEASSALNVLALVGAGVFASVALPTVASAQDVTAGSLSGTVTDDSGNPVSGAAISVESSERGFSRTTTTNANGNFSLSQLPIGNYAVTITAPGYQTTRSENVGVNLGGSNYNFPVSAVVTEGDVIVVTGRAVRTVDFSGTATGAVFNVQNVVENIPVPRNIEAIQLLTPGVTSGDSAFGGVSISGSSVAENVYYINGMNITNFRTFVGGTTVPFEFYDQVQVKTGGYQAEFGRNTGGAVIALTRSGGNEFHGGFNASYIPDSTRETVPNTYSQNNSLDKRTQIEGNLWLSGPILADRLFFFGFFNPRHFTQSDTARVEDQDEQGNLLGTYTDTTLTSRKTNDPFYGGKLDLNLFDGHRVEATYFNDSQDEIVNQTVLDTGESTRTTNFAGGSNMIFKYTGAFTDWLTLSALYGKSKFDQTSQGDADTVPYVLDGRSGSLVYQAGNPAGVIDTGRDTRENYRVDADISFDMLGSHNVRMGFDRENLTAINTTQYSGGTYYRYYRSGANGAQGGLIDPNTDYVRVRDLQSGGEFGSKNTAFYIQDDWDVTDQINLSLGVRNDKFENSDGNGNTFTTLKNQWQPRIGINFDPTGEKRARLSAFYGRYYIPVAANTNIRLAGAEFFTEDYYTLPVDGNGNYNGSLVNPTLGTKVVANILGDGEVVPASTLVSKNLSPQYLDEFIVGGEYNVSSLVKLSANFTYRKLGAVLEDVDFDGSGSYNSITEAYCATQTLEWCSPDAVPSFGSGGYVLLNPGKDLIVDAVDENGELHELTIPNSFFNLPKAKRNYYAAEFKMERAFDGIWGLNASYVWARSKGNYEGGVKSDNGQDDTGLTQDFDELGWMDGASGYLPNHRTHTFKVFGNVKPVDNFNLGFNAIVQSPRKFGCVGTYPVGDGRATDDLAASWYCNAQIEAGNVEGTLNEPVGRGNVFDSDWTKRIDLSAAYTIPFPSTDGGVTLRMDVFNVFNFKSKLDFNEFGDLDDQDVINPYYQRVTSFQTGRYFRFGISGQF